MEKGDGVAIEVPFGTSTALILLSAKEAHLRIGAGLATFLSQCWGAWSVKQHGDSCTVARCGFVPNALHRAGLAMDAAIGAMMKLRQVNRLMNPDVPEPNAWQVVAERLGIEVPTGEGVEEAQEQPMVT